MKYPYTQKVKDWDILELKTAIRRLESELKEIESVEQVTQWYSFQLFALVDELVRIKMILSLYELSND